MKKKRQKLIKRLLFMLFIMGLSSLTYGQITISGRVVTSNDGSSLPGVNVLIKGTSTGSVTDLDGNYSIEVPNKEAILMFSFVGYLPGEVAVGNQTNIDVTLVEDITTLEDVVVIGYGTMKKKDITGAVASIGAEDLNSSPIVSIDQGMQGKMAGVTLKQITGAPGAAMKMRIRGGSGSINYSNEPLYVIDGFVGGDLTSVQPQDIERIDILKDASATAIYGSRGANGVVLITTKTAKSGEFNISLDAMYGIGNQVKSIDILDAGLQAEYRNEQRENLIPSRPHYFTDAEVDSFKTHGGHNHLDEITRRATTQNYNLTMSGGSDKLTYLFSAGYLDEEGIVQESFNKKFSVRSNISAEVKPWLDLKFQTYATHSKSMHVSENHRAIKDAYMYPNFWPTKDSLGNYISNRNLPDYGGFLKPGENANPVWYNKNTAHGERLNEGVTSSLEFKIKFTDHLSFTTTGALRYSNNYEGQMHLVDSITITDANQQIKQVKGRHAKVMTTNNLYYHNTFGKHFFSANLIYEYSDDQHRTSRVSVNQLATTGNNWHILGNGSPAVSASEYNDQQLQSFLGRINYTFSDRYLFTGTLRYDESSVFSQSTKKSSPFPSAALGWIISEESFMSGFEAISNLKLRAGWGKTANQAIPAYGAREVLDIPLGYFGFPGYYTFDGTEDNIAEGVVPQSTVNSHDVFWETQVQSNVGLDLSLLRGKVNMTADYYSKQVEQLIFKKSVAAYTGKESVNDNFGSIRNSGFEFTVDWRAISKRDFTMNVGANIALNKSKVLDLGGDDEMFPDYNDKLTGIGMWGYSDIFIVQKGEPLGLLYGIKDEGLWTVEDSLEASLYGSYPGEPKFQDINNDSSIDASDRQVIGNTQPDFTYGIQLNLTYKNWNLSISGFGTYGNEIYNYNRHYLDKTIKNPEYINRWTYENQGAEQQRLLIGNEHTGDMLSSRYVENGSFFKINNVTLGYNLPDSWLEKVKISSLNVYISVNNLLTITKYSGVDPENSSTPRNSNAVSGLDSFSYPLSRTFIFGLKTNF